MSLLRTLSKRRLFKERIAGSWCSSSRYSTSKNGNVDIEFGIDRASLRIGVSEFAGFADGCCVAGLGDTSVMVTAVSKEKPSSTSFLPLTVDYKQKAAAAGRIPTSSHRRDTYSEQEILVSRLIDRSLRPLFASDYFYETQLICNLLALDGINDPEVLSINAASAALSLSDIPWNGPVGAVRVGLQDDTVILNPTRRELSNSSLNMVVTAANQNLVIMLEACANNILQPDFLKAVKTAVQECQKIVHGISQLQKHHGKKKRPFEPKELDENLLNTVKSESESILKEIFQDFSHDKLSRDNAVKEVKVKVIEKIRQERPEVSIETLNGMFDLVWKETFRSLVLHTDVRCDGRTLTQLRHIRSNVDMFKPLHGSAFFQRGQTQVLCTVSLDSINSALHMDPITMLTSGLKEKNFFLHYEFPPYAVKEVGRLGPAMRREVGHGALAEKGLRAIVPSNFPFTIRLTSEVLQSNGSSSMASICAGSLALLDAGVPITSPAAGVAIGLITKYEGNDTKHIQNYKILTDILGIEDYMGDMDFKIAGTKKGITALQADIKIPGLPLKIVMEAIQAGWEAKSKIIDIMNSTISEPREEKKISWPVTDVLDVPVHKRGKLLGQGGIHLKQLFINNGVQVTFQEETDNYQIFAPNQLAMDEAMEQISTWLSQEKEPLLEFGAIYTAKITELRENGVMVTLYNNMRPALLHNNQLDQRKVSDPRVLGFEVGQEIQVKFFGHDPVSGQMRLSRKVLMGPASSLVQNLQKTDS
ncbi:polyribonucleotide nucleotidyltransferase 1, mitochondrial [Cimex lectularius]|uniref:polyribonucleotide nucleotidyltransferase n=1 Tax=Cimex lectularius TaxID=79782 RepID=A0A8I6RBI2_CIMLE|nr:polyribonucleotide nucleotidyltransferase 1, mitochondrial [Cimex lectularius]